uniref:Uncharacterized protein n=1 Tax=Strongyloides papillosus TaxID=174720 RepID=A0A0N5CA74_STREA
MNFLKLLPYIQLIFITVIFCNCYKFNCQSRYVWKKKCFLFLSVTEESYRHAFLCLVPTNLKKRLLQYTAVDRFKSVGLLNSTNTLLGQTLTKQNLLCIAAAFDFKPRKLSGVYVFQNKNAVRYYNRNSDVDKNGRKIRKGSSEYLRMSWSDYTRNMEHNKHFMKKMGCLNTCSSFK